MCDWQCNLQSYLNLLEHNWSGSPLAIHSSAEWCKNCMVCDKENVEGEEVTTPQASADMLGQCYAGAHCLSLLCSCSEIRINLTISLLMFPSAFFQIVDWWSCLTIWVTFYIWISSWSCLMAKYFVIFNVLPSILKLLNPGKNIL